jgi:hypothetical protein
LNLVDRHFLDRAPQCITGVVDQDVDPAKVPEDLLDGTTDRIRIGNIQRELQRNREIVQRFQFPGSGRNGIT